VDRDPPRSDTPRPVSRQNVQVVRAAIDRYNETGDVPWEAIDPT
jgi:hypothetical protein